MSRDKRDKRGQRQDHIDEYEANKDDRRQRILDKDLLTLFPSFNIAVTKVSPGEWLIVDSGREIHAATKKAAIRDWYILNEWAVD